MRVGAIESPMFVVFQKIFFRTVGLFKKFLSSFEVMVHHIFRVWVPSQNFWKSKKCLWMSKIDFHKKFEKSFHDMFLMITASFKTFDESNVSNRVHIYCFDVYLCVSWREMRQNCKNHWTTAKINFSQLSHASGQKVPNENVSLNSLRCKILVCRYHHRKARYLIDLWWCW